MSMFRLPAVAPVCWAILAVVTPPHAYAQPSPNLPPVVVEPVAPRQAIAKPRRAAPNAQRANRRGTRAAEIQQAAPVVSPLGLRGTLVSPPFAQAVTDISRTPGAVAIVPGAAYRQSTPASTIKDVLDYVPGVIAQPKWGDDTRLSIRGSGLSRNFHLRGVQLYMDGIPINTADGYGDFQEIDPSAYKYVEVYKGANALRFGANALGGAINFVTPTGRDPFVNGVSTDAGAFGFARVQASAGGATDRWDGFATASAQRFDGFRQHSDGQAIRASGNIGYRVSDDMETRFYLNANEVRQRIPGTVTRSSALTSPETPAVNNVLQDQQRNIDTVRLANKTAIIFGDTLVEFGAFGVDRHLMHPIFQWLDYRYADYGGFARATDDRYIGGFRNRLVVGANVVNGRIDNQQFVNVGGQKGALTSSSIDRSKNTSLYAENSFYVVPSVALIAGTQYLIATRDRRDRFLSDGDQSGSTSFALASPKAGIVWTAAPHTQVFANLSRSAEVPSFGESANGPGIPTIPFTQIRPQRATTAEIGARGNTPDMRWEFAFYRMDIKNELLCLYSAFGNCNVTNADRSRHQGIEAGGGLVVLRDLFTRAGTPDRLWLNIAYTLNDFTFVRDALFGNNQLPGAPRHYLRAEMMYRHSLGFFAGPNVEWVPQAYFVDSANTTKTQAYALLGLKAGFDAGGNWSGYIEGRNLTNKIYIASTSIIDRATAASALYEPGTGRAVYAGVKYRW